MMELISISYDNLLSAPENEIRKDLILNIKIICWNINWRNFRKYTPEMFDILGNESHIN